MTSLDQVAVEDNGTILVRLRFADARVHRFSLPPDVNLNATVASVNADLARQGRSPLRPADVARIQAVADEAWTVGVIADYRAAQDAVRP